MTIQELLIKHEGLRLKPYRDTVGKLSIGVGRNLDDVGITNVEAAFMLNNDINRVIGQLQENFDWYDSLDDVRKMVVVDMTFNLGIGKFSKFVNTIDFISRGMWDEASKEMLRGDWAIQVGKRATELSEMMRSGEVK